EKLCGRTNIAPHSAHPLYRLSTACKRKIYQSEKRKVIGQTTHLCWDQRLDLVWQWLYQCLLGRRALAGTGGGDSPPSGSRAGSASSWMSAHDPRLLQFSGPRLLSKTGL